MRSWLNLPLLALLALLAAPLFHAPAQAQGEAAVMNWRLAAPVQRAAPQPAQAYRARRRYDAPRARHPDDSSLGLVMPEITVAMPALPDASRIKIALVGDSLAEALSLGLEADPAVKAEWLIRQKTVSASGLVRDDYHDWPKALAALIAENPDLAGLVVMLGLNDRQVIRSGDAVLEPLTDPWREAYRKRVDTLIQIAQAARVPLVWVGMPVVRAPKLSADLASLNDMIRNRVTAGGETYVEIFDGFADQSGAFTTSGPDVIGDIVRLRGPDGIHFTPAGQRKLAFFVDRPLRKRIGERALESNAALASLPANLPTKSPAPGTEISIPLPAPAALSIPRPRVEIGEIRALSTTNTAKALVGRQATPIHDPATRDLFDRGLSPPPRSGRSDDYRWR